MNQHPGQHESRVEAYLSKKVRDLGGLSFKIAPTHAGLPDRMVLLPGFLYLIEVKDHGGAVSPIQHLVHARMRHLGTEVYVVWGTDGVDEFFRGHWARLDAANGL